MQTVIMWKYFNPDRLFGGYGWSLEEVCDGWNNIYSNPYYVEIPDDFALGEAQDGSAAYFRGDDRQGYEVAGGNRAEGCNPYLIGGSRAESIRCRVIGPVPDGEVE